MRYSDAVRLARADADAASQRLGELIKRVVQILRDGHMRVLPGVMSIAAINGSKPPRLETLLETCDAWMKQVDAYRKNPDTVRARAEAMQPGPRCLVCAGTCSAGRL